MKEPKKYPTFGEDWSSSDDSGNDSNPENGASEGVRDQLQPSQARARCVSRAYVLNTYSTYSK
eukprot:5484321-Prymnesium_polylepis.1